MSLSVRTLSFVKGYNLIETSLKKREFIDLKWETFENQSIIYTSVIAGVGVEWHPTERDALLGPTPGICECDLIWK